MAEPRAGTAAARPRPAVAWRRILVPEEHGVWSLWAEPALAGLLLAPSAAGGLIGVAGLAAVLAQQPAALAFADRRRGRSYPRTVAAARAAAVLALVAAAALAVATLGAAAAPAAVLAPLALALPLAGIQLAYDARFRGRSPLPQVTGAVALGALAPLAALAGGAPPALAWTVWAWLALRAVPGVLAVGVRVRRGSGRAADARPARLAATAAAVVAVAAFLAGAANGLLAGLAVAAAVRVWGTLRPRARPVHAARIGIAETVVGLAWVLALVAAPPLALVGPAS